MNDALTNDSPDTVLFSDMIRSSTEGLFTANGEPSSVHKVSEELPSCGMSIKDYGAMS